MKIYELKQIIRECIEEVYLQEKTPNQRAHPRRTFKDMDSGAVGRKPRGNDWRYDDAGRGLKVRQNTDYGFKAQNRPPSSSTGDIKSHLKKLKGHIGYERGERSTNPFGSSVDIKDKGYQRRYGKSGSVVGVQGVGRRNPLSSLKKREEKINNPSPPVAKKTKTKQAPKVFKGSKYPK